MTDLPELDSYHSNTPERIVLEFLYAWAAGDWKQALTATQLDWRSRKGNNAEWLEKVYGFRQLHKAEILGSVAGKIDLYAGKIKPSALEEPLMADVRLALWVSTDRTPTERKEVTARLLKESGPMRPSASGTWGVNPQSMLRGLAMEGQGNG